MRTTEDEGDVCRFDDQAAGFIAASLVDWQAFYLYRDLAKWRDLDILAFFLFVVLLPQLR